MGRKKSASKSQATFVDEEASLFVIENQELMAMSAAKKIWPASTTTEDQLRELVSDGLLQSKEFADWRALGEHRVPALSPDEIILFVSAVDVSPPIACHGGYPGQFVRASAYAELDGKHKRQSIYPGSGPRS